MLPDLQHQLLLERRQRLLREADDVRRRRLAPPRRRQPLLVPIRRYVGLRLVAVGSRLAGGGQPGLGVTRTLR